MEIILTDLDKRKIHITNDSYNVAGYVDMWEEGKEEDLIEGIYLDDMMKALTALKREVTLDN